MVRAASKIKNQTNFSGKLIWGSRPLYGKHLALPTDKLTDIETGWPRRAGSIRRVNEDEDEGPHPHHPSLSLPPRGALVPHVFLRWRHMVGG